MKRILYISTNSDEAGAPRHCELILQEARKNYDVFFITGEKGAVYRRLIEDGVKCMVISRFRNSISPVADIFVLRKLLFCINDFKPDIIHLHSAKAGLLGRLCGYLKGVPTIYTVHGFSWRGMSLAKRLLIIAIEKLFAKIPAVNYVLVSNEQLVDARHKLKLPDKRIEVIHNGVEDVESSLIKKHAASGSITIVMVARVCSAKDHITLFKAFADTNGSFRLILCGQGTDSEEFIDLARGIVGSDHLPFIEFLGERNDIEYILSRADVFVLSSNFEALPISIIEAMRSGLPIVATAVGGVPELVTPDCGYTFAVGDVSALKNYLHSLDDIQLRIKLGAGARDRYLNRFSKAQMIEKLHRKYKELIND